MSPRKTRRGVVKKNIATPDSAKREKTARASPKAKSRSPSKKRITRASKAKITSDSEDNQSKKVSKKSSRKKSAKTTSDSLITDDESVTESPRFSTKLENSLISEDESTSRNQPPSRSSLARIDTTPKSSPIAVTLTPHRATKTPRRSPENFGSPKTHSDTPLRHSKTPRKLEIKDSPTSSEESKPEKNERITAPKSPSTRSKPKSPTPKKSPQLGIASKSTKRATRNTKQSPSPKKKNSPGRMNLTVTAVSKKVVPRSSRRSMPASKLKKSPIKLLASLSPKDLSKVAVVVLEKLENSEKQQNSTPISTPPPVLGDVSPKRPKSVGKKRSIVTDLGTPLRPTLTPKHPKSALKNVISEKGAKIDTSIRQKTRKDLITNYSTPKEGSRVSLNLSVTLDEPSFFTKKKSSTPRNKRLSMSLDDNFSFARKKSSTPRNKTRSFSGIENESEPLMNDTSLINMSDVFDSDVSQKEEKEKDGTYEVIEPKTPSLIAKKAKKRLSTDANLNKNETENKKVRFAESEIESGSSIVKLRSGTPGHKLSSRRSSAVRSKSRSPQRLSRGLSDTVRRRSSSASIVEGTPRTPAIKSRINSVEGSNLKSSSKAQMVSVNRLSRPRLSFASEKKTVTKTPVPRNIPNFAEIHKKTFAKMESLVDAKKRVEERHIARIIPLVSASKSNPEVVMGKRLDVKKLPSSSQVSNGSYNRFGFKVRKNEAVESISKKQSTMTSEKKKSVRREVLKGVRTNRRFELQMKSRRSLSSK